MSDMKKLNDEALENVTGGARRTVSNDSSSYSWVRSGPGKQYDTKSITAIQSTPQAIMYTAAAMTGTNWMTGIILQGR